MALSDDQRAMLQLLLEGGQSYADIAALLGVDAEEVRSRARRSLTELGGDDPDTQVGLTDYLLGQADPIGRADVARHLQSDPAASALAAKLATQLRLIAPKARLPDLPGSDAGGAPTGVPSPAGTVSGSTGSGAATAARSALGGVGDAVRSLGSRDRRVPVALGAGGLLVLIVVLFVTGVFGGSSDNSKATTTGTSTSASADVTAVVPLDAQNGSGASGQVVFVQLKGDQLALQINLAGLKPTSKDESYIIWLYNSDKFAFPLTRSQVGKDGNLTGAAPVPSQVVQLIRPDAFNQIDVSLASNSATAKAIQDAAKKQQGVPPHSGKSVLRGAIPASAIGQAGTGTTGTGTTGTGTTGTGTTPTP